MAEQSAEWRVCDCAIESTPVEGNAPKGSWRVTHHPIGTVVEVDYAAIVAEVTSGAPIEAASPGERLPSVAIRLAWRKARERGDA